MTTSRLMLFAAATCLALAGCETRTKKTDTNKPETTRDAEHTSASEAADEAAETTRDAADTTVAAAEEVGENAAEATRDAADDTLRETERVEEKVIARGETLPPEPGVDMPEKGETP